MILKSRADSKFEVWLYTTFGKKVTQAHCHDNGWIEHSTWYELFGRKWGLAYFYKGPPTVVDWTRVRVYDPDTGEMKIVNSDEYERERKTRS